MTERALPGHQTRGAIRSEARGPHWVAWLPDADGKPEDSVVLIGGTQEEAEERARDLLEQQNLRK